MYSSNAMPSWKNTERGRCLSQPYTRRSEPSSPHPSRKTLRESTQRLVPSSQQSKAMIRRQQWQPDEERELEKDEAPSLLSRMSQNNHQTKNLSPKNQRSTTQPLHGQQQRHRLVPTCPKTWSRRSNSLEFKPWTLRRRYDRSPTPPVVQNFLNQTGRMLSEGRPSIWMQYSVDSSPQ